MAPRSGDSPSLDKGLSRKAKPLKQKSNRPEESAVRNAVRKAPVIRCHRENRSGSAPSFAFSETSGRAYGIACKSWSCPACSRLRRQVVAFMVERGIERRLRLGEKVRFLTLTEDPEAPFTDAKELQASWNRFKAAINRKGRRIGEYVAVTEMTKRGRPHVHCLFEGEFIAQAELVRRAEAAGFGRIVDIREVKDGGSAENSASYVSKELAGYVSKGAGWAKQQKRRPVRVSRGWYPGGQEQAKADLLAELEDREEKDPGKFWHVYGHPEETLTITGRNEDGEVIKLTLPPESSKVKRLPVARRSSPREERSPGGATKKAKVARLKGKRDFNETFELKDAA